MKYAGKWPMVLLYLLAAALVVYAVMLLLVLIYFTGNGEFIYEL